MTVSLAVVTAQNAYHAFTSISPPLTPLEMEVRRVIRRFLMDVPGARSIRLFSYLWIDHAADVSLLMLNPQLDDTHLSNHDAALHPVPHLVSATSPSSRHATDSPASGKKT